MTPDPTIGLDPAEPALPAGAIAYARVKTRSGRLTLGTKLFQGLGAWPEVFKTYGFGFVVLYYTQVLGLDLVLASLAFGIAIAIDGLVDPIIGSWSDGHKSRLGRRHPFMYAAILPVAVALYAVFAPPEGLAGTGLFLWLLGATVATNVALSFFGVPWTATFAELTDEYSERTALVAWRFGVGWTGGLAWAWTMGTLVFATTADGTKGQLNPDAYPVFAPLIAVACAGAVALATHLTRREVPYMLQPVGPVPRFTAGRVWREVRDSFANRNFTALFLSALIAAAIGGTGTALGIFIVTYFWGLSGEDLRWFSLAGLGALIGFGFAVPLERRFDKKWVMMGCFALLLIDGIAIIGLKLLGLLPPTGSESLLALLVVNIVFRTFLETLLGIMFISMLADALDAQEVRTGRRQEGMFAAALSLSTKATAGIGTFAAGLLLAHVIGWPASPGPGLPPPAPDADTVLRLAVIGGLLVPLLYLVPFSIGLFYRIDRTAHAALRATLAARRREADSLLATFDVADPFDPVPSAPPTAAPLDGARAR